MKKSALLTALPLGVATEIRPEPVNDGTEVEILVAVAELTKADMTLNLTRSLVGAVSKFVPLIVTAVPAVPIVGVKLVMVGSIDALTVKGVLLVAEPAGVVTAINPEVAPDGTLVTISVAVAAVTVAATPLKVTAFWLGVVLNDVPWIVTSVPAGPWFGLN